MTVWAVVDMYVSILTVNLQRVSDHLSGRIKPQWWRTALKKNPMDNKKQWADQMKATADNNCHLHTCTEGERASWCFYTHVYIFIRVYVILRETSTNPSCRHRWGGWASLSAHLFQVKLSKYLRRKIFLCSACVKQLCTKWDHAQLWNECVCSLSPHLPNLFCWQ